MLTATDPAAYTSVTRNHQPCLRCTDCGREGAPGAATVTHARNCDLTGMPRSKVVGPVTQSEAADRAEISRIRSMAAAVRRGEAVDDADLVNLVAAGIVSMSDAMNSDF
jgi:hypothetical protein